MISRSAVALALSVAVLAPPGVSQAQQATFSSRVEMVRADVLVTDRQGAVRGLEPADFDLRDNGTRQTIELVSFDEVPLNVVMALDMSSSLTAEQMAQLRSAGQMMVSGLRQRDKASLITFTQAIRQHVPLTSRLEEVSGALQRVEPADGTRLTALVDAAYASMIVAESEVGRSLVVVFSDGADTVSWLQQDDVVEISKRSDAVIYAVATRRGGRSSFLEDITDASGGSLLEIESTKDLGQAFLKILDEYRHRYLLSYAPTGVAKDGWHKLSVRVPGRDVKVKARPGYWAEK
jgi:VWFA-related protein